MESGKVNKPKTVISTPTEITEDEWIEQYNPRPHPTGKGNGYDYGDGSTLLDASPQDREHLDQTPLMQIWSVIEGDEGQVIAAGRHWVNCLGWIVTEEAWAHDMIEVILED